MDKREQRILVSTCYGHFMSHFNMLVFPALVLPLTVTLNLEMAQVLGISLWMYLLFGLTALPWGMAADRFGSKPFMLIFFAGSGISSLAAAYWIDSPLGLSFALASIGLFSGIYHPTGLGLISKEIKQISVGMGYNGMFGNLGIASAPLIAGVVNWFWGIKAAYLVLGFLNFMGIGLILFLPISETYKNIKTDPDEENFYLFLFLILLVAMMLGGITYRGSTLILPSYFELRNHNIFNAVISFFGQGVSKNVVATLITSMIFVAGMLGQYTGGRIAEKFDLKLSYLFFHAVTVPIAFFMAFAWDIPLVLLAIVYFFFLLGMQPIENTLVSKITPRKFHHSAYGTKFVLTFGVGSIAVKMVGFVEQSRGISYVFPVLGMISLALVAVIVLLIIKSR